ncbi:hypothetical protein FQA39_LY09392 [Lamprigera yunnana]|nr:hypothetical protein FQA39_LY09392 [Lamprigera yunnana]
MWKQFLTPKELQVSVLEETVTELELERNNGMIDAVYIPPDVDELTEEENIEVENTDPENELEPIDIVGTFELQVRKMSNNVVKRENVSSSANVLMCKQWWKVCWMYGDQEKYYRQLYGKQRTSTIENNKYENVKIENNLIGVNIKELCESNINERGASTKLNKVEFLNTSSTGSPTFNHSDTSGIYSGVEWTNGNDEVLPVSFEALLNHGYNDGISVSFRNPLADHDNV